MKKFIIITVFTAVFSTSCGKAIVSAVKGAAKTAPKTIPKVTKLPKRIPPGHIPPVAVPEHIPVAGSSKTAAKGTAEGVETFSGAPISTHSLGSTLKSGAKKADIPNVSKKIQTEGSAFADESLTVKGIKTGTDAASEIAKDPLSDYLDNMFDEDASKISTNPLDGFWFYFIENGNKQYGIALNRVNGREGGYMMIVEGETQTYLEFTGKSSTGIEGSHFRLNRTFENIIVDNKIYDKSNYTDLRFNFMLYKMASDLFSSPSSSTLVSLKKGNYSSSENGKTFKWTKTSRERFAVIRRLWRNSQNWK